MQVNSLLSEPLGKPSPLIPPSDSVLWPGLTPGLSTYKATMVNASIRRGATCLQASRGPSSTPLCGVCCPASLPFAFRELLTPQSWWGSLSHLPLEPQKGARGRDSARCFPPGGTGTQKLSAGCEDGRGRASLLKPPGLLVQVGEAERRSAELPLGQNPASLQGPLVGEGRHCSGV